MGVRAEGGGPGGEEEGRADGTLPGLPPSPLLPGTGPWGTLL